MRPREQADPDQVEHDRREIRRLELEARRFRLMAKRKAGGPHGPEWERWSEAGKRLVALVDAEVPDLAAAKRAYWWGRVGPVTDSPEGAA